jgi:hypothetical protein
MDLVENGTVVNEYSPQTEFHLAAHKYSAPLARCHHQAASFVLLALCLLSLLFTLLRCYYDSNEVFSNLYWNVTMSSV